MTTAGLPPELEPDWPLGAGEAPPDWSPIGAAPGFDDVQPVAAPTSDAHMAIAFAHVLHMAMTSRESAKPSSTSLGKPHLGQTATD